MLNIRGLLICRALYCQLICLCGACTLLLRTSAPLETAAPLPSSVGVTADKLLSGDVEVTCSIPEANCMVSVHSINCPTNICPAH